MSTVLSSFILLKTQIQSELHWPILTVLNIHDVCFTSNFHYFALLSWLNRCYQVRRCVVYLASRNPSLSSFPNPQSTDASGLGILTLLHYNQRLLNSIGLKPPFFCTGIYSACKIPVEIPFFFWAWTQLIDSSSLRHVGPYISRSREALAWCRFL